MSETELIYGKAKWSINSRNVPAETLHEISGEVARFNEYLKLKYPDLPLVRSLETSNADTTL